MHVTTSTALAKEDLGTILFPHGEVLKTEMDKTQRYIDLQNAMLLGNAYHSKVRIIFETEDGIRHVETTIWYATETFVLLKGGLSIPVRCIHEIIF